MKKSICIVMSIAVIGMVLGGCGMYRTDGDVAVETPYVSPIIEPEMSPIVSPDMEDGIVDDRDGIIEEDDMDRGRDVSDSKSGNMTGNPGNNSGNQASTPSAKP